MVGMNRVEEYKIKYGLNDVKNICNKEKTFPNEWINAEENDISEEFLTYLTPLIQGESKVKFDNGMPCYCFRDKN